MKFTISKEEYDALEDSQKALYKESGDIYQLAVDGLPDVTGLQKKVDELLDEKKKEQQKRKEAEELAKKAAEEQAKKNGDVEALEKSWAEKLAAKEQELMTQINDRDSRLKTLLVDNVAQSLSVKLAGDSAAVLMPHIRSRLIVEDGKTRIIDNDGKPSALTLDDLEKEFRNNKLFAPIVIGSKATGTGGNSSQSVPSGNGKKWSDYSEAERIQLYKENPEEFKRLQATQ